MLLSSVLLSLIYWLSLVRALDLDIWPVKHAITRHCALQGIREYQSDTFDDWRDLLEEQERRTRDELDASKVYCKLLFMQGVAPLYM